MLFYVYAYSMSAYQETETWPQLLASRVISYHDDAQEASSEVTRLINEDWSNADECFAAGCIPLCHDEHNLA